MKKKLLITVTPLISLGWNLRGYPFNGQTHKALAEIPGGDTEMQDGNRLGEKIRCGKSMIFERV